MSVLPEVLGMCSEDLPAASADEACALCYSCFAAWEGVSARAPVHSSHCASILSSLIYVLCLPIAHLVCAGTCSFRDLMFCMHVCSLRSRALAQGSHGLQPLFDGAEALSELSIV